MSLTVLRKPKRLVAVVLAIAAIILGVSTSAAATPSRAAHHHNRIERILALSTDANSNSPIVIAIGPIHARGTDKVVNNNNDVFVFPKGSINVHHKARHTRSFSDPKTCYGTQVETGVYRVNGGTGAYKHAHGHGHYRVTVAFVGCDQNAAPDYFSLQIKAVGPLHI